MKTKEKHNTRTTKAPSEFVSREEFEAMEKRLIQVFSHAFSSVAAQRAPEPPSPETLAMIAAALAKGLTEKPATAIQYASDLYDAACARLEMKSRYLTARKNEIEAMSDIPRPKKFPATLNEFLSLIVSARTPADSMKRFRDYVRYQVENFITMGKPENYTEWFEWAAKKTFSEMTTEERHDPKWAGMTDEDIGVAKQEKIIDNQVASKMDENQCFNSESAWLGMAKSYHHWWASCRSKKAQAAAKKGKK